MIKKIFIIITCLVITFILTIVPCFANSVSSSDDMPNYDNYIGINWSGVSLDKSSFYTSYYESLDDYQMFSINNIDALTYTSDPYLIVDTPPTSVYKNITRIRANSGTPSSLDILFRGAYHDSTYIRNFRNTSVLNTFSINNIRQWTIPEDIDLYNDVLYMNCVLPYGVINDIRSGDADSYLSLTFNFTVDILSSYDRDWLTVSDSISYGFSNRSLRNVLVDMPIWTDSLISTDNVVPDGFEVVTFFIPYTDILDRFKQDYIINGNTYLGYDSVFTKNFSVTPSCEFDSTMLRHLMGFAIDLHNATSVNCDLYSSLVNTYTMDGKYIALEGRNMNTLPIFSAFTTNALEDYSVESNVYDNVMKGMGYDNVYVDGDVTSWLGSTLKGLFDIELFGSISIGSILSVVLGVGLVMMIIKFFAGG